MKKNFLASLGRMSTRGKLKLQEALDYPLKYIAEEALPGIVEDATDWAHVSLITSPNTSNELSAMAL